MHFLRHSLLTLVLFLGTNVHALKNEDNSEGTPEPVADLAPANADPVQAIDCVVAIGAIVWLGAYGYLEYRNFMSYCARP